MNQFAAAICGADFPFALDPFNFDTVNFTGGLPFLGGSVSASDVNFYGLSDSTVISVSSNITDSTLEVNATSFYPIILITGVGNIDINLGSFHINMTREINVTMTNVFVDSSIEGATENINGTDFLVVQSASFVPQPQGLNISVADLGKVLIFIFQNKTKSKFNFYFSDPCLSNIVNQNALPLYNNTLAETQQVFTPIVQGLANQIFSQYPYNQLVPPA